MTARQACVFFIVLLAPLVLPAQQLDRSKNYFFAAIGFWNVENLYDTLNDQWKNDEDFTPAGANAWDGERYRTKIRHLADAISQMATDVTPDGLAMFGLCEVENKSVVLDLVRSPQLKGRNYCVVHIEGPDARGIDPSFVYNPAFFQVKKSSAIPIKLVTDSMHKTRDVLLVSGSFLGEGLTVLVNHWPSRRGGENESRTNRNAAAQTVRRLADSIAASDQAMKILVMGDFNDDPVSTSVATYLSTYADMTKAESGKFYNPMEKLFAQGIGTLAWRDNWNLFDQILLNQALVPGNYSTWQYYTARVFNKPFLRNAFGKYKGYPFRSYIGTHYTGGYSDHFPVYIILAKEKK